MASFIYGGGSPIYNMAHLTSIFLILPGMMAFENNLYYHFIFAQFVELNHKMPITIVWCKISLLDINGVYMYSFIQCEIITNSGITLFASFHQMFFGRIRVAQFVVFWGVL